MPGRPSLAWDGSGRLQGFRSRSPPSSSASRRRAVALRRRHPGTVGHRRLGVRRARSRARIPSRPIARSSRVDPKVVVAPRLPRLARARRPGGRAARSAPASSSAPDPSAGAIVQASTAGTIPTGRRVAVTWPAGSRRLPPGRYRVRSCTSAACGDRVLARTARAPGHDDGHRPRPGPPPGAGRPAAPAPGAGVFPVAGPHTLRRRLRRGAQRLHAPGPGHPGRRGHARRRAARRARCSTSTTSRRRRAGTSCRHGPTGCDYFFAHCQEGSIAGRARAGRARPASRSASSGTPATRRARTCTSRSGSADGASNAASHVHRPAAGPAGLGPHGLTAATTAGRAAAARGRRRSRRLPSR